MEPVPLATLHVKMFERPYLYTTQIGKRTNGNCASMKYDANNYAWNTAGTICASFPNMDFGYFDQ